MLGMIIRFIVSALVLMVVGWILPGFEVAGFTGALIAAVVIAVLGYLIESFFWEKSFSSKPGNNRFCYISSCNLFS